MLQRCHGPRRTRKRDFRDRMARQWARLHSHVITPITATTPAISSNSTATSAATAIRSTFHGQRARRRLEARAGARQLVRRRQRRVFAAAQASEYMKDGLRGSAWDTRSAGGRGDQAEVPPVHALRPLGVPGGCWNAQRGMCMQCAPDLERETAAAQAQHCGAAGLDRDEQREPDRRLRSRTARGQCRCRMPELHARSRRVRSSARAAASRSSRLKRSAPAAARSSRRAEVLQRLRHTVRWLAASRGLALGRPCMKSPMAPPSVTRASSECEIASRFLISKTRYRARGHLGRHASLTRRPPPTSSDDSSITLSFDGNAVATTRACSRSHAERFASAVCARGCATL